MTDKNLEEEQSNFKLFNKENNKLFLKSLVWALILAIFGAYSKYANFGLELQSVTGIKVTCSDIPNICFREVLGRFVFMFIGAFIAAFIIYKWRKTRKKIKG